MLWKLGELIGMVEEVDERCLKMEVVEFARLRIVQPSDVVIPQTLLLDLADVRFSLRMELEPRVIRSMEEVLADCDRSDVACPLVVLEEEEALDV